LNALLDARESNSDVFPSFELLKVTVISELFSTSLVNTKRLFLSNYMTFSTSALVSA
jgi:hypothetical protein